MCTIANFVIKVTEEGRNELCRMPIKTWDQNPNYHVEEDNAEKWIVCVQLLIATEVLLAADDEWRIH